MIVERRAVDPASRIQTAYFVAIDLPVEDQKLEVELAASRGAEGLIIEQIKENGSAGIFLIDGLVRN